MENSVGDHLHRMGPRAVRPRQNRCHRLRDPWTMSRVDDQRLTSRRFGPEFVEEHRRKLGKYPPEQRQLTYAIAVTHRGDR